jgi:RNA polymerase sigma factor (sigma-70 family)
MGTRFETTRWSLVRKARQGPDRDEALGDLCRIYWPPLYSFLRRQGCRPEEAEDLTQAFFARLIEKDWLQDVEPDKGRLRSFLLVACRHFLANERDHQRALKRGGARGAVSLDLATAEERYRLEPRLEQSPEKLFDRRWALTVLQRVLGALREELPASGRDTFDALRPFLLAGEADESYAEVAPRLGMRPGTVRVAVLRLRRRFQQRLRAEIADTVADPADVDAEIRYLIRALSG